MKKAKVNLGYLYFLKLEAKYHPLRLISVFSGVLFLYCGIILSLLERSYIDETTNPNDSWGNLWMTVVTMTTVGYGDAYPRTHYGRAVALIACICGKIIMSFFLSFSFFPLIELYLGNR